MWAAQAPTALLLAVQLYSALASVEQKILTAADKDAKQFLSDYAGDTRTIGPGPSGLMYRVFRDGTGDATEPDSKCSFNYQARLSQNYPDGPTFDSSPPGHPVRLTAAEVRRIEFCVRLLLITKGMLGD